jgi:hypothetical protein
VIGSRGDNPAGEANLKERLAMISKAREECETRNEAYLGYSHEILAGCGDEVDQSRSNVWMDVRCVVLYRLGAVWEIKRRIRCCWESERGRQRDSKISKSCGKENPR